MIDKQPKDCKFYGKREFATPMFGGDLIECHRCKNKEIEFIFCETAIRLGVCKGAFS